MKIMSLKQHLNPFYDFNHPDFCMLEALWIVESTKGVGMLFKGPGFVDHEGHTVPKYDSV